MADDPNSGLMALLREGGMHAACAADGTMREGGSVPPGSTLVRLWHLDFGSVPLALKVWAAPAPVNYDRPEVWPLLQDMLQVRCMSRAQLAGLVARINDLPRKLGHGEGGLIAATLLGRIQQALTQPSAFPPLLSNDELRAELAKAKALGGVLGAPNDADTATKGLAGAAAAGLSAANGANLGWAGRTVQAALDRQKGLDAYRKTGIGYIIWVFSKFILGQGKDYQDDYAKQFRDEMLRRGLAVP
jgi:hypothetical protein